VTVSIETWRAGGESIVVGGRRIFVRVAGAGPAVLLIHGFPTASWDWHRIWNALSARYQVVTCDLLGFGFSDKPRISYRMAAQADVIEAVAAWAGVTSAAVVAHDYGNTVGQELLARANDKTLGFALTRIGFLNGGLFPETHRPLLAQRLLASRLGGLFARLSSRGRFDASMRAIAGATAPTSDELAAMWQLATRDGGRVLMPALLGYIAERRRFRARWVGALVASTVPVRLIDGLADPISGAHMVTRYRELVAHPDIVELPGVGHYPQLEAPAATVAALLDWLS
jgi:pimeloyl-ACP methyl ester carboxylesterase